MKITVKKIAELANGTLLSDNGDQMIVDCVIDSRKATENSMFIPFKGEKVDGYDYIQKAVLNGCKCVFIEEEKYYNPVLPCEFILVENNLKALQSLAKGYRESLDIKIIGVTGSNGKTTTKDLVTAVAKKSGHTLKTVGNLNNEIGLPLTLLSCEVEHRIAVLEMGMSDLGEIDLLSNISNPDIGIITNIGESHLENLKTKDNILKAKSEIFNHMNKGGVGILNGDDPYLLRLSSGIEICILYGFSEGNDIIAKDLKKYSNKTEFMVSYENNEYHFEIPLLGEHNVLNSLAAIAVGIKLGIKIEEIANALLNPNMTSMRTEIIKLEKDLTIINDCYNASETSTLAALKVLDDLDSCGNRKVAILGDMLELGNYTEIAHNNVGEFAAQKGFGVLCAVGQFSKYIIDGAKKTGYKGLTLSFSNSIDAAQGIVGILQPKDIVLVKGSRGVKMEAIVDKIKEEF